MVELLRSNNPVVMSLADALLTEEGIGHQVVDQHMSTIEGSLNILQSRLLVVEEQFEAARRLLAEGGLFEEV